MIVVHQYRQHVGTARGVAREQLTDLPVLVRSQTCRDIIEQVGPSRDGAPHPRARVTARIAQLVAWLRGVASGTVAPTTFTGADDEHLLLAFTEPNVAFSLAERAHDRVAIRVHLSLEGRPPGLLDESVGLFEHVVLITCTADDVARAAAQWEHEMSAFPPR